MIVEFALALVLLMGAGLLIRSFARLLQVDPGFRTANLLTLRFEPSPDSQNVRNFYERLETRLRSLPGIEAVASTNALPLMTERGNAMRFVVPDSPLMRPDMFPVAHLHLITPDYFRTLGIALRGRAYNARDLDQPSVIINETMARTYWPGQDAVGKRFVVGPWGPQPNWATIIGVAADVKQSGLEAERTNDFYFLDYGPRYLILQTASDPLIIARAVRREIQALDPAAPVSDFPQHGTSTGRFHRSAAILHLAAFDLRGRGSGAGGDRNLRHHVVVGSAAHAGDRYSHGGGSGCARHLETDPRAGAEAERYWSGHWARCNVRTHAVVGRAAFEISPHDPWVLAGVSMLMLAVTTAACYLPARRAAKVDPIDILRAE